jgi:hypothetical protein
MDPSRKRKIRLFVALGAAVLLAGGLMFTSFTADTPATTPSQLLANKGRGRTSRLPSATATAARRSRSPIPASSPTRSARAAR